MNCVETSTVDSPVTVKALEAMKNASIKSMGFLPVTGKYKSTAPTNVVIIKSKR
ncbi:Uncharacterised protein [Staphylococcus aureus]|nr:Uncharacterised protein [Staphylococcus aureus]